MEKPQQFTDKCAVVRGLQIAQDRAPLFYQHIEAERQRMELIAQEVIEAGHLATGRAMKKFAHDL